MKGLKKLAAAALFMVFFANTAFAEENNTTVPNTELIEETFVINCSIPKTTGELAINGNATVFVELPADYYYSNESYPVCYVFDGKRISKEEDALGLHKLYGEKGKKLPGVIYVGIDTPENAYRSAILGAPMNTTFFLVDQARGDVDTKLQGKGDYYTSWVANTLKPYIDTLYRTKTDAADTGVIGWSSGGSAALIAAIINHQTFNRVAAFSPATWMWEDWFYGAINNEGYFYHYITEDGADRQYSVGVKHIDYLYMYQGGNDGSAGHPIWALNSVDGIYELLLEKGAGAKGHTYVNYREGTHSDDSWKQYTESCITFLFPEYIR